MTENRLSLHNTMWLIKLFSTFRIQKYVNLITHILLNEKYRFVACTDVALYIVGVRKTFKIFSQGGNILHFKLQRLLKSG